MFLGASKLRELRLWGVMDSHMKLEIIALFFPCLAQLSLLYKFGHANDVKEVVGGELIFEKVVLLQLGYFKVDSLFDQFRSGVL